MTDVAKITSPVKSMQEVNVCSFINPYLFWITVKNRKKEAERDLLEKKLEETYQYQFPSSSVFIKGEIVVVKHDNKYKRGIIEDMIVTHTGSKIYSCWLMDYGKLFDSNTVFKYNSIYDIPPFAKQACIDKIAFVEQKVKDSTAAVQLLIEEKISNNDNLLFMAEYEALDIVFGDILYSDDGDMKSFRDTLVEKRLAIIEENFIKEFDFKRFKDKTQYLSLLRHSRMNKLENKKLVKKSNGHFDIVPDGLHPSVDILSSLDIEDQDIDKFEGSFRMLGRDISGRTNKQDEKTSEIVKQISKNHVDGNQNLDVDDMKKKKIDILMKRNKQSKPETSAKSKLETSDPKGPNDRSFDSIKMENPVKKAVSPDSCRTVSGTNVQSRCVDTELSESLLSSKKLEPQVKSLNNESFDSIKPFTSVDKASTPEIHRKVSSNGVKSPKDAVLARSSMNHRNATRSTCNDSSVSNSNVSVSDSVVQEPNPVKSTNKQKLLELVKKRSEKYVKHASKPRDPFESESDMEKATNSSTSKNVDETTTDCDDDAKMSGM